MYSSNCEWLRSLCDCLFERGDVWMSLLGMEWVSGVVRFEARLMN